MMEILKRDYREWKEEQQELFNNLPIFYAFSNEQFNKCKEELGIKNDNELYKVGHGGYIKKTDSHKLKEWDNNYNSQYEELKKDMDFMYSAFLYEFGNYEYCITFDDKEVLEVLDLTFDDLNNDKSLMNTYLKAKKEYLSHIDEY